MTASVSVFASVAAVFAMKWGYAWRAIYADAKKAAERRFSWLTIYSRSNSVAGCGNSGSVQDSHPPATMAEITNSTVEMPRQDLELSNGGTKPAETTKCSHVSSDYDNHYVPISELLK